MVVAEFGLHRPTLHRPTYLSKKASGLICLNSIFFTCPSHAGNANVELCSCFIRLVTEGDKVCIYHSLENTRIYQEVEPQYIEVSDEVGRQRQLIAH